MTTSTITNTILDGSGTGVSGVTIIARLRPGPGFRVSGSTEIADVRTTTNGSGVWSLALEKTANIDPSNSYWEIEEQVPAVNGGPRLWAITVTTSSALYANLITSLQTAAALPTALTQTAGDARYAQLGANVWTSAQTLSDGVNVVLGSTTGSKFGTATSQKIGFLNATPVAQQANTVDICTVLSNFGFRASGGAPPATLGATTVTTLAASSTLSAAATTVTTLHATGAATLDSSLSAGATTVTTLHATGAATLDSTLSAAATTVTTLHATGAATLDAALTSGATSVDTLTLRSQVTASSANTGGGTALPANPVGYITIGINGSNRKIPYFDV